jgi:hypothetical protein
MTIQVKKAKKNNLIDNKNSVFTTEKLMTLT